MLLIAILNLHWRRLGCKVSIAWRDGAIEKRVIGEVTSLLLGKVGRRDPKGVVGEVENELSDTFIDRRIFYFERDKKLILSEIFAGDSTTYYEFVK